MLTVRRVLEMGAFAASSLVAGRDGIDREVRWAHPVDIPDARDWIRPGELLLTTFFGLRDDPEAQRKLCDGLAAKGLAGMVVAVGQYLDHVPESVLRDVYEQALETLALLPALGTDQMVATFDDLGQLHWLHTVPPKALNENSYARRSAVAAHARKRQWRPVTA